MPIFRRKPTYTDRRTRYNGKLLRRRVRFRQSVDVASLDGSDSSDPEVLSWDYGLHPPTRPAPPYNPNFQRAPMYDLTIPLYDLPRAPILPRSSPPDHATRVTFINGRPTPVILWWFDYYGNIKPYSYIYPYGGRVDVRTYLGHSWMVTDYTTNQRLGTWSPAVRDGRVLLS